MRHLGAIILSQSAVIAAGLEAVLSGMQRGAGIAVSITVTDDPDNAIRLLEKGRHHLLIADPLLTETPLLRAIEQLPGVRTVAIAATALPADIASRYDRVITVYDTPETIVSVVTEAVAAADGRTADENSPELTPREKEIVRGIVHGMSNKEIAGAINVSVNTVTTHRRNIASKLGIHSPAGLTIYAIVRKLVTIEELQ